MESFLLLGTALVLGLRHGIDWDHIAALVDISGAAAEGKNRRRALFLSLLYACGHAFIVTILGIAAIEFTAILPAWFDSIMERIVGLTLFFLGFYLIVVVTRAIKTATDFHLQSRWMLVLSTFKRYAMSQQKTGETLQEEKLSGLGAFAIGVLHGLGAETGTQVLLISAIGGAAAHGLAMPMLIAFVIGLVFSNTVVALLATSSFKASMHWRPIYLLAGGTAGLFSLALGVVFMMGSSDCLPDLQNLKLISQVDFFKAPGL